MISTLEHKTPEKVSDEFFTVFRNLREKISTLANQAPETIVESVHLIRKRLKFLRAFVKLTKFCSDGDTYKEINYILRDCGRLISDCRDAHVRSMVLEEWKQNHVAPESLVEELTELNNNQTAAIEDELLSGTSVFDEVISNLSEKPVINYFSSLEANADSIFSGYIHCYKKSYDAFHLGLTSHEADLLHEWRKRTKDLQYQQEVLVEFIPDDLPPSLFEVSELCEILGKINDLYMLTEWVNNQTDSVANTKTLHPFLERIQMQLDSILNDAEEFGQSLYKYTPDEYNEKLTKTVE